MQLDAVDTIIAERPIVPDADYYRTKARQCFRQALVAIPSERAALKQRGIVFEFRARAVEQACGPHAL